MLLFLRALQRAGILQPERAAFLFLPHLSLIHILDAYVRSIIQSQCHWFIVDDLNHLKRGGRVSSTAALVGTMLGIKPVMHTDSEGRLTPVSKARGTKAALRALVDKVGEIGVEPEKNQPMLICHANCPESVEYVKGLLKERFGVTDVRDEFIGPVIGAHTGCGTLGLFFVGTCLLYTSRCV